MERLVMTLGSEEMRGLTALMRLERQGADGSDALERTAATVLREGIASELRRADLPWAPDPELVETRLGRGGNLVVQTGTVAGAGARSKVPASQFQPSGSPPQSSSGFAAALHDARFRVSAAVALGAATLIILIGGYGASWNWTGFSENNQLWDWLHLLLLPIAFATFPIWLRYAEHISQARKYTLLAAVPVFVIFVVAGYLVPIKWTGFTGNTLWDWLTLVVLPLAVVTARAWPNTSREIRTTHLAVIGGLAIAWLVTILGGYIGGWRWTGYQGNELWDWLQLLLAPLLFTTVVAPSVARWMTGNAARRAKEANTTQSTADQRR